ncbi:unknown protein [Seminavis robusta]|uniref:Uncharacterized protein n=1 Tax=Seminavis robusta TaxID=568900 RepID=A0A9N8DEQ9_9STRA|nr:unknown protein [Seminavis robusta]|eukprot:Sro60_g034471.1  (110) ;mRNA; f:7574-7903
MAGNGTVLINPKLSRFFSATKQADARMMCILFDWGTQCNRCSFDLDGLHMYWYRYMHGMYFYSSSGSGLFILHFEKKTEGRFAFFAMFCANNVSDSTDVLQEGLTCRCR